MTTRTPLAADDRRLLAQVLRTARSVGWKRTWDGTWKSYDGKTKVTWDPEYRLLGIASDGGLVPGGDRRIRLVFESTSVREVLDVLAAFNVVPQMYAPAYRDGVRSGTDAAERRLHEYHNSYHAGIVHELDRMIVALGVFVDKQHEFKSDAGCRPEPDKDCEQWCGACEAMADLFDEHVGMIHGEMRVLGYDR